MVFFFGYLLKVKLSITKLQHRTLYTSLYNYEALCKQFCLEKDKKKKKICIQYKEHMFDRKLIQCTLVTRYFFVIYFI